MGACYTPATHTVATHPLEAEAMVKVGIVGSGFMGLTHAEAYAQLQDVAIVGFVGRGEANRRKLAANYGTSDYPTMESMLAAADVDVLDICTPTHLNLQMVRTAAGARKPILLEKPVARTVEEAEEIQRIVADAGVPCMVAHVVRFWPQYERIRDIVNSGQIGAPRLACAQRICQPPDWTSWYEDPKRSGGVPVTLMVHDLDFCNWLFGKPAHVVASGHKNALGGYDDMDALVRYASGVAATFRSSIAMPPPYPFTMSLRVTGDEGVIEYIFRAGVNVENREHGQNDFILYRNGEASVPPADDRDAYVREIDYFLRCLREGTAPAIGMLEEATLALRTAWAAIESAEQGAAAVCI